MKDKLDFIRDAREAMRKGIDFDDWLSDQLDFENDEEFQNMLRSEGITADDFWQEIEDTVKGTQDHLGFGKLQQKTETKINKWLTLFTVRNRTMAPKYKELEKYRGSGLSKISRNPKVLKEKTNDEVQKELDHLLAEMQQYKMENGSILEDMWEKVITRDDPSGGDSDTVNMALENLYHEVGELNLMLANDRKMFYVFWDKVQDKYPELVKAVNEFKEAALKAKSLDKETKDLIRELEAPEPYIEHFDMVELKNQPGPVTRILNLLLSLGGKQPRESSYEVGHSRTTGEGAVEETEDYPGFEGVQAPSLSQRTPASLPGEDSKTITNPWEAEGSERPADIETVDMEVDPILLWHLLNEAYEINVGLGDDYKILMRRLRKVKTGLPKGNLRDLIESVVDEIEDAVSDIPEGIIHLPLTHWLKEVDPTVIDRIDRITRETGKFFGILNRLLLTSGTFPVHIDTRFGGPSRGAAGSTVQVTGKSSTDPKSFRQEREQGFNEPKERDLGTSANMEKLIKALVKSLNEYYFNPMSSNFFLDEEKPDFTDEGGADYGDTFDPDQTTQEGRYPYRALEFSLGTSPKSTAEKNLLKGISEEGLFDLDLLNDILEFIKKTSRGFDLEGGWDSYKKELQGLVLLMDKLFPDHEDENRIWAAGKLGEILINHQQKLDKVKLFGKPISELYKRYIDFKNDPTKLLPMNQLRQLFGSSLFENEMRAEMDYRGETGKEWAKEMQTTIESILKLTDPKEEPTAKDKITEDKQRLKKSILIVHDYIRKMNNKAIHYGSLDTEDIEDMDYLISKIEKEDRFEVNTTEISYIVDSIDSHNNISKSFGVTENVVYKIKGLCR